MNLIYGWDEYVFKDIAERAGSKQAKRDVSYCRTVLYHNARKLIAIRYKDVGGCLLITMPRIQKSSWLQWMRSTSGKGLQVPLLRQS